MDILVALTILVVLLLFYFSKKMICNSYGNKDSRESPQESNFSSTTSPSSTEFSRDGYAERNSFDLGSPTTSSSTGYTTRPSENERESYDDPLIDTLDSVNYFCDRHHHYHQSSHYVSSAGCLCNFHNNGINNNNHGRTNIGLGNSTACNERRQRCDDPTYSSQFSDDSSCRQIDSAGLQPISRTSYTETGSYQEPIPPQISVIATQDFQRESILEAQLCNQLAKIVQVECEIQRLSRLLSPQQHGYHREEDYQRSPAIETTSHHQHYHDHCARNDGAHRYGNSPNSPECLVNSNSPQLNPIQSSFSCGIDSVSPSSCAICRRNANSRWHLPFHHPAYENLGSRARRMLILQRMMFCVSASGLTGASGAATRADSDVVTSLHGRNCLDRALEQQHQRSCSFQVPFSLSSHRLQIEDNYSDRPTGETPPPSYEDSMRLSGPV